MKDPREKPLGLDMGFGEALRRFIGTDPKEVADAKEKRGPVPTRPPRKQVDDQPPERPAKAPLD